MMTPEARAHYHGRLWPAACEVKGWRVKDEVRRQDVVLECMAKVKGPAITTSHSDFGADETTALFCYLEHLAAPADLRKSARWLDCQKDYVAYNRSRQADWHQRQAYGYGGRKLTGDRFKGQATAQGDAFEEFNPTEARKRHMTMANRHRRKKQKAGEHSAAAMPATPHAFVTEIAGRPVLGPELVAVDHNCPF